MNIADLPDMIKPSDIARVGDYAPCSVYSQCRHYTSRAEAYRRQHGRPWAHESDEALPLDNELPAVYLIPPHMDKLGNPRGGRLRIYRDLLLYKWYGVRDYGFRSDDVREAG